MSLHAPSPRRERVIIYADRGGGKSSAYISIGDWLDRTHSDRKVWLYDTDKSWEANRDESGALDPYFNVVFLDRERFGGTGGWAETVRETRPLVHPDDWVVVDLQTHAWEAAQSHYWGQRSGNSSLAELWLRNRPQDVAGDHGVNWGIINKFYWEFTNAVTNMPCHVMLLASAKPIKENNERGKGGDDLDTRNFYGKVGYQMEGQKDLRGEGHTVLFFYEANGTYRFSSVKERGPIGRPKRELVVNKDITVTDDRPGGFVPGYLMGVAKWKP